MNSFRRNLVRFGFWLLSISLGAWFTWASRFTMNPDGVSYLDIGDAWWRGDWHHAMSAYWSPLYSWILGCALKIAKPSIYWEFPLVHLIDLLIYVVALGAFEFFLTAALSLRPEESKISEFWLRALGYSLFVHTALWMIGMDIVSPDLLVAGSFYLVSGLAIKAYSGKGSPILLGIALGFGYLAKTILLPVGAVLLFAMFITPKARRQAIMASAALAVVSLPWILACSTLKHHLTIGESGRWNYLVWVDGVLPSHPRGSLHQARRLVEHPATYDLSNTSGGTYPVWYDPSYWQEGLKPTVQTAAMFKRMKYGAAFYGVTLANPIDELPMLTVFIIAALTGVVISFPGAARAVALSSLAGLAAFLPLYVEGRYVAPFLAALWLLLFVRMPLRWSTAKTGIALAILVTLNSLSPLLFLSWISNRNQEALKNVQAAMALRSLGIGAGSPIGVISKEQWLNGFADISFVPRLAHLRISAETVDEECNPAVIDAMRSVGAQAILTRMQPLDSQWVRLGETSYFALPLQH